MIDIAGNNDFWRMLRHNRLFILTLAVMMATVGASLYFGSRQIFQKEADRQHQLTVARVEAAQNAVKLLFVNLSQDLAYLRGLEVATGFAGGGQGSAALKSALANQYQRFLDAHAHYLKLTVHDRRGVKRLKITCSRLEAARAQAPVADSPDGIPPEPAHQFTNRIWFSLFTSPAPRKPGRTPASLVIRLSVALPGAAGRQAAGYLSLYLGAAALTEVLPKGVYLQTREGLLLEPRPGGPPLLKGAEYKLTGDAGWLPVSEMETIHYRRFRFLPDERMFAVAYHRHPQLRQSLNHMMILALALLAGFSVLAAVVGVITFSRYYNLLRAQRGMIFSLAGLADGRDPETGDHLERTRRYAVHLAGELRKRKEFARIITRDFMEDLYAAAPLHDIGKVGIPDAILLKPGGLSDEEYEVMKTHVLVARKVLANTMREYKLDESVFSMGLNIATHHHERYDGQGYPDGLAGDRIPLEARIFALCDAYDAIRSKRPYKGRISHQEAARRIVKDSGKHFDPRIVEAFVASEREFNAISQNV